MRASGGASVFYYVPTDPMRRVVNGSENDHMRKTVQFGRFIRFASRVSVAASYFATFLGGPYVQSHACCVRCFASHGYPQPTLFVAGTVPTVLFLTGVSSAWPFFFKREDARLRSTLDVALL